MSKTYSDLLRDPKWQKRRLEILQRDEFLCRLCQDGQTELHVHHKFYITGTKPWEYEDDMLTTLCKRCHSTVEALKQNLARHITFEPTSGTLLQIDDLLNGEHWVELIHIINHLYEHPSQIAPLHQFLSTTIEIDPPDETFHPASN